MVEGPYTIKFNSSTEKITAIYDGTNPPFEIQTTTIYFVNTNNWENVYIHFWGSADPVENNWPGIKLEKSENSEYYSYTINNDVQGLLFNPGSDDGKTSDLTLVEGSPYYVYDGSKKDNSCWAASHEFTYYTITIETNVESPTINFEYKGETHTGNSISVLAGSELKYTISKDGYNPISKTITVNQTETISENLDPIPPTTVTLTINPTPSDATVTIFAEGFTYLPGSNSITVNPGDEIEYIVSKDGYIPNISTETIDENCTLDVTLNASDNNKLYFVPSLKALEGNARFAAYFFGNGDEWQDLTDENNDGIYEVAKPEKNYTSVIFCRMNPNVTNNGWGSDMWGQTADLDMPTGNKNVYYINGNSYTEGSWDVYKDISNHQIEIIGSITDWKEGNYVLTRTGVYSYIYKNLELEQDDEIKIRNKGTWDGLINCGWENLENNTNFENSGGNIKVKTAGTYNITLNTQTKKITIS